MLYQLSHFRSEMRPPVGGAESQIRTGDTAIFSRVLYQLSYLGPMANQAWPPVGGPQDTTGPRGRATRGASARRHGRSPSLPIPDPPARPPRRVPSGGSPVSWRSRLIRSMIGGWVEISPDDRASNFLIGFVKYRCCVAAVGDLEHLLVGGDLRQRPFQAVRVARQLDRRRIGEVLALAAHGELDEARGRSARGSRGRWR